MQAVADKACGELLLAALEARGLDAAPERVALLSAADKQTVAAASLEHESAVFCKAMSRGEYLRRAAQQGRPGLELLTSRGFDPSRRPASTTTAAASSLQPVDIAWGEDQKPPKRQRGDV